MRERAHEAEAGVDLARAYEAHLAAQPRAWWFDEENDAHAWGGLSLQMVQAARRGNVFKQGRGHVQPAAAPTSSACITRSPSASGKPSEFWNSSGAAPVPPSAPSTVKKSGVVPASSIA